MKSLKKKLAALGVGLAVMASSVVSMSASAWSYENWRAWFAPYTGTAYAFGTSVQVMNMQWNSTQIANFMGLLPTSFGALYGLEFEFSPDVEDKSLIWDSKRSHSSNLPQAYSECQWYDPDDVTIGTRDIKCLTAETSYYGYLYLNQGTTPTSGRKYRFSVEFGEGFPPFNLIDYLPIYETYYENSAQPNVNFGSRCHW